MRDGVRVDGFCAAEFVLMSLRAVEFAWRMEHRPTTISRRSSCPDGGEDGCRRVCHTMGADGAADGWTPRGSMDLAGGGEHRKYIQRSF